MSVGKVDPAVCNESSRVVQDTYVLDIFSQASYSTTLIVFRYEENTDDWLDSSSNTSTSIELSRSATS
jgi:hypothetical protein